MLLFISPHQDIHVNKQNQSYIMIWYHMMWYHTVRFAMRYAYTNLINTTSILQNAPTSFMSVCMLRQHYVNLKTWSRHYSANMRCADVLKTSLARNKLQKLKTRHAKWHKVVLPYSTMLNLLRWCSTHSASLRCFFTWRFGTNNTCTAPIPAWKNMPMMAIIASLPLASSALSFLVFSAGSEEVKTLNPKSPAAAGVPGDWSWETSQKAM